MAANIFSSASWHKSANVGRFADTKRLRSLRRMNAARRWRPRSDTAAKPHQALEACVNLAMTTEWKIVCSETSSMPWARKTITASLNLSCLECSDTVEWRPVSLSVYPAAAISRCFLSGPDLPRNIHKKSTGKQN